MNGEINNMREYSDTLKCFYEAEDVVYISNMQQNTFYMEKGAVKSLRDITVDRGRIYFVWEKTQKIHDLYNEWNERKQ